MPDRDERLHHRRGAGFPRVGSGQGGEARGGNHDGAGVQRRRVLQQQSARPQQHAWLKPDEREAVEQARAEAPVLARLPLKAYLRRPAILATAFAFFGYAYILYFFLSWFPSYLTSVSRRLSEENAKVLDELASVNRHVDHIKTIVAMQQSYADLPLESCHLPREPGLGEPGRLRGGADRAGAAHLDEGVPRCQGHGDIMTDPHGSHA